MKDTKQPWFKEARLGMFMHWGLYSQLAGEWKGRKTDSIAEWIMNDLDIPVEEYRKIAAEFNPVDFDADKIIKLAHDCGMKYFVFTAKHHDGFAMYHSRVSKYNIVDATPFGRDVLKELQLACEKYGMKLGLYYSQAQDWDDPDGFMARHDNSRKNFDTYLYNKCIPQIKEILTGYGEISVIWFDTPMELTEEQSNAILKTVKDIQPNCIISGRIGNGLGDYLTTGDNFIPARAYEGDWEVPATLNDTWGFSKYDENWKSARDIRDLFVKINSRGGNYLINIGPDGKGNVPQASVDILREFGSYVTANADSIYGTRAVVNDTYELDYGLLTSKAHRIFVHVLYRGKKRIELLNIGNRVTKAYIVDTRQELEFRMAKCCEGNSAIIVDLPEEYRFRTGFCICLETEEDKIIFEPLEM